MEELAESITKQKKRAYNSSIWLLAKRDYSRFKLENKLKEKKFSPEVISETIQLLLEKKFLQEDLYIEARIRGLMRKNYSPCYIQRALANERLAVDSGQIADIFTQNQVTTSQQIDDLLQKKSAHVERKQNIQKSYQSLLRFLLSKGHDQQVCHSKIKSFLDPQSNSC